MPVHVPDNLKVLLTSTLSKPNRSKESSLESLYVENSAKINNLNIGYEKIVCGQINQFTTLSKKTHLFSVFNGSISAFLYPCSL